MTELLSIILAAGEGTRMKSTLPKVLHPVGGMPIVGHVARAARQAGSSKIALVTGPRHAAIRERVSALDPEVVHATLGVVLKYQDDIARFDAPAVAQLAGGAGADASASG